jgi:lipopolysaccharide transport system ATP-binding protein
VGEPETVISVESLSKQYVIRHAAERGQATLRDVIARGARRLTDRVARRRPANDSTREEFWALRDVSFGVKRGEVVGIIGRNGAGKSTLLKILSRITEPTSGRIEIHGRVASLLEVGTGFHGELTGRENIYLNGAILGMTRAEIKRKFDEIVAFAEIEKFLDTPVKRYSSGMYMRLAFAVAAHLEPEILVVDEVLAVGDAEFQKKCLGKMDEVARGGRTVLFVSHNLGMIRHLCQSALYLVRGRAQAHGPVEHVIREYQESNDQNGDLVAGQTSHPSITSVLIDTDALGQQSLVISVSFSSPSPFSPLIGVIVSTQLGQPLFGTNQLTHPARLADGEMTAGTATMIIRSPPLHSGTYSVSLWLTDRKTGTTYAHMPDFCTFEYISVNPLPNGYSTELVGPIAVEAEWRFCTTRPDGYDCQSSIAVG